MDVFLVSPGLIGQNENETVGDAACRAKAGGCRFVRGAKRRREKEDA